MEKYLLTLILANCISSSSYALTCVSGNFGGRTSLVLSENGSLGIGFLDGTRNVNHAVYKYTQCKNNYYGKECSFEKSSDQSTHKNMPNNLYLEFGNINYPTGILLYIEASNSKDNQIIFDLTECSEFFKDSIGYEKVGQ